MFTFCVANFYIILFFKVKGCDDRLSNDEFSITMVHKVYLHVEHMSSHQVWKLATKIVGVGYVEVA